MDLPMIIDIDTGSSHGRGGSSGHGDEDREDNHDKAVRDAIIRKEEKDVRRAKAVVVFAIIACAVAVSVSVYFFAKQNDQNTFEVEVRTRARLVLVVRV